VPLGNRSVVVGTLEALLNAAQHLAKLLLVESARPRLLSEPRKILKERGAGVTLDGEFGRDLEEIIRSHRELLSPSAWD
jgi:hypothetical protein